MAGDLILTFRRTLAKIAEIEKRILAEQLELAALRGEIEEIRAALKSDSTSTVAVDDRDAPEAGFRKRPIRDKSSVGWAKRVLKMNGGPMHVDDIIKNVQHMTGMPVNKTTIVSSLSKYVKAGDTFKRTAANTFALIEDSSEDDVKEIRLVG